MKLPRFTNTVQVLTVLAGTLAFQTWAQPGGSAGPADPASADAPVPRAEYRSSFTTYRAYQDQALGNWRQSNDTVGAIGGWRAYARENTPEATGTGGSPASSGAGPRTGEADPHAGHAQAAPPRSAPGAANPPAQSGAQGKPPAMQHDMKEKMQGMHPDMQQKMKEKMQGMSPEMRQKMREKMHGTGTAKDDARSRGEAPQGGNSNDAHQNH
jgi:hypothetical protein